MYKRYIKRILDIVFSFFFLVILSPLFLVIMLLICLDSKGGPFYKQQRIGRNEKVFIVVKKLFVEVPKFEQQMAV